MPEVLAVCFLGFACMGGQPSEVREGFRIELNAPVMRRFDEVSESGIYYRQNSLDRPVVELRLRFPFNSCEILGKC